MGLFCSKEKQGEQVEQGEQVSELLKRVEQNKNILELLERVEQKIGQIKKNTTI